MSDSITGCTIKILDGQYKGRLCIVLQTMKMHGTHGFAEVVFLGRKGERTKQRDLVPIQYLTRAVVDPNPHVSTQSNNG